MRSHTSFFTLAGVVVVAALLGITGTAQADLMGANGQHIAGLDITLSMVSATDAAAGTTTVQYQVALADDPAAEWSLLGFLVLRDMSEGPFAAVGSPPGWGVTTYGPFVDWESFTAGSEIHDGEALGGFTYTYFGDPADGRFYHYVVSKDGGKPFRVISEDPPRVGPAAVPEPTSLVLITTPLVGLMTIRRHRQRAVA